MKQWEYQVITYYNIRPDADGLNTPGREGWELCSLLYFPAGDSQGYCVAFFKRPLPEGEI